MEGLTVTPGVQDDQGKTRAAPEHRRGTEKSAEDLVTHTETDTDTVWTPLITGLLGFRTEG